MRADESHVVHVRVVGTRRTQEAHHGDCTTVRGKGRAPVLRNTYVRRAGGRSDRADRPVEGSRGRRGGHGSDRGLLASPWEALTEAGIEARLLNARQVNCTAARPMSATGVGLRRSVQSSGRGGPASPPPASSVNCAASAAISGRGSRSGVEFVTRCRRCSTVAAFASERC